MVREPDRFAAELFISVRDSARMKESRGAFRTRAGLIQRARAVSPLCCKILDPLEFQGRRFAFTDDGRPLRSSRGKIIALATAEHNFMVP